MINRKIVLIAGGLVLFAGAICFFLGEIMEGLNKTINLGYQQREKPNRVTRAPSVMSQMEEKQNMLDTNVTFSNYAALEKDLPELNKATDALCYKNYADAVSKLTLCLEKLTPAHLYLPLIEHRTILALAGTNAGRLKAHIYQLRATAYLKQKQYELAAADLQASEALYALAPNTAMDLFINARQITGESPGEAIDLYSQSLGKLWTESSVTDSWAMPPENRRYSRDRFAAWIYASRGYQYLLLKQYTRGIDDLSRAIALRPNYKLNYINRANAYRLSGRPELADTDLQLAKKLKSDDDVDERPRR
jgi:tetratricopeptide (TPR) repeat protein